MENVTLKAMRDFYKSGVMDYNYYSGTTGFQRRYERQYLNLLSKYGNYAFNYDNVTSNYRGAYVYTCEPQGLVVGTLGTEELKWRFRHIIGNRASVLLVAMLLDKYTYKWAPKKGSAPDTRLTAIYDYSQRLTDTNKCVKLVTHLNRCYLRTVNCEEQLMFVCAEMTGTNAHDLQLFTTKATYDDAQRECMSVGKMLVPLYSGGLNHVFDFLKQENITLSVYTAYYTGHYLVNKEYTYRWLYGIGGLVKEQDMNFRSTYTNDTKDSHQQVIYYPDTDSYGLAILNSNDYYNFVCQSRYPSMWLSAGRDNNTANILIQHRYTKGYLVSSENFLSYACSIDTVDIVRSLVLPRK
ncbi:uncharacterized protein LOC117343629 [Pecten maximus]|uniref:uncharacterized protein LOC117343629 n=1 Tax=Pecten maximus TaxID=6579 RepID=UPI0014591A93|nr:uncharacterized protein LOC117343629 [Pecten maximus]